MTTPLSKSQLERLRRDAKRLAREKSIHLWEAQQELATERGYRNWSLLVEASNAFQSVGENLHRRAFATLFMRRSEEPLLPAIATQLGHLSENAVESYLHVARRPGAKTLSEQSGILSAEAVDQEGALHDLDARSTASCRNSVSSTASMLADVASTLGHQNLCIATAYLNTRRHRAKRDS